MLWQPEDVQTIIEDICKLAYAKASKEEVSSLESRAGTNFCLYLQTLLEAIGFAHDEYVKTGAQELHAEPFAISCTQNTNAMPSETTVQGPTGFQQELEIPGPNHPDYPYYLLAKYFTEQTYEQAHEKLYTLLNGAIQNNLKTISIEQMAEMRSFFNGFAQLLFAASRIYEECIEVEKAEPGNAVNAGPGTAPATATKISAAEVPDDQQRNAMPAALQQAISLIKNAVHPEKIFLVNPEEKDAGIHFDMLVLISRNYKQPLSYYQYLIEKACEERIPGVEVTVSVHKTQDIYPLLKQGHIFYSVACNPQYLIYDNGQLPLPKPGIVPIDEIVSKVNDDFAYGMDKAVAFLDGARHFMFHSAKTIAPQLLYQATELTLQTVCNSLLGYSLRTNNLSRLLQSCRRCAPGFDKVFQLDHKEDIALFQQLQRSHPQSRNQANLEMKIEDLQQIANRIEDLQEMAETARLKRILSFKSTIANWPAEILTPAKPEN